MSTSLYQSTVDPKLTNIGLFYKKEFYEKASNFLGTIQSYTDEVQRSIDFQKTKVANDVITSQADFFAKLDNELSSAQPQFAANWINVFNNTLNEVKNQVGESVHYRQFSDSIGGLVKIENYLDDSTQLVSDVQSQQTMAPLRYGSSLSNKISPVTLNMMGEFSKKINLVFRKNIQNIQDTISSSTKAHGSNLVPDTQHFVRMKNIFTGYTQKIQTEFKSLYNVIDYYCRYNPRTGTGNMQVVTDYNITISVEGNPINQDLLQNQLADTTSKLTTMKVLG